VASAGASPGPGAGRETRDPGATCARLLDPAGTRAHVPRRRAARIVRAGATGAARPAKPRARREAAAAPSNCVRRKPQRTARRGPARDRRRRRAGAQNASPDALARLLDPAATRALATPAVTGSHFARGKRRPREAGEAARLRESAVLTRPRRAACSGPARDRRRRAGAQIAGSVRNSRAAPRSRRHARPRAATSCSNLPPGSGSNAASGRNGPGDATRSAYGAHPRRSTPSGVVDVVPLRFRRLRDRVPGGEHLNLRGCSATLARKRHVR